MGEEFRALVGVDIAAECRVENASCPWSRHHTSGCPLPIPLIADGQDPYRCRRVAPEVVPLVGEAPDGRERTGRGMLPIVDHRLARLVLGVAGDPRAEGLTVVRPVVLGATSTVASKRTASLS